MALGSIVQQPTPTAAAGNVSTFASPVLSAPTVGNTDIICAVSSSTITTPTGYVLDESNVGNAGMYIFRRTVQAGDTGAAVTLAIGTARPAVIFRWELQGTAAIDNAGAAHSNKFYNSTTTTARSGTALTTVSTTGLLVLGSDEAAANKTWSSWTPAAVSQVQASVPTGGTGVVNGILAYGTGVTAGIITPAATSTQNGTKYQVLAVAYVFTAPSQTLTPTGFSAAVGMGSVGLASKATLTASGFTAAVQAGSVALRATAHLSPTGFSAPVAFGTVGLVASATLTPAGFTASISFGELNLVEVGPQTLTADGFTVAVSFGTVSLPIPPARRATVTATPNPSCSVVAVANPSAALLAAGNPTAKVVPQ